MKYNWLGLGRIWLATAPQSHKYDWRHLSKYDCGGGGFVAAAPVTILKAWWEVLCGFCWKFTWLSSSEIILKIHWQSYVFKFMNWMKMYYLFGTLAVYNICTIRLVVSISSPKRVSSDMFPAVSWLCRLGLRESSIDYVQTLNCRPKL